MRSIFLAGAFLLLAQCNMHSELNLPQIEDTGSQKAKCSFKPQSNCWTRSLDLLMDCVGPIHPEDHQILYPDRKLCANQSGQHIIFHNPDIFGQGNLNAEARFSVYGSLKKCFEFKGNMQNFIISSSEFGDLSVLTLPSGEVEVQCFFDESFVIPKEAVVSGCQGSATASEAFVPKGLLSSFQDGDVGGFQFNFYGVSANPLPLFQCYEAQ